MKFIKKYEDYIISDFDKYYLDDIKIEENDKYIILDLSDTDLNYGKLSTLNDILKNKFIIFNCETHNHQEEIKISHVDDLFKSSDGKILIVYDYNNNKHIINLEYTIKISKFDIEAEKYNL